MRKAIIIGLCMLVSIPGIGFAIGFAIGSINGTHSIRYDDRGTWLCWKEHGHTGIDCWLLAPVVPSSYVLNYHRGFIGCQGDKLTFKNITIDLSGWEGPNPLFSNSEGRCVPTESPPVPNDALIP